MKLIRGISGIRGIAGDSLTDSAVISHARAFAEIQESGPILVARDSRPHGAQMIQAAEKGLMESGRDVLNAGIIPTPTAQFLVEHYHCAGGIVITASHNPIEWNGLKFIHHDGCFLNGAQNQALFKTADRRPEPSSTFGSVKKLENPAGEHIESILKLDFLNLAKIRQRKFKVAVDAVNGAAFKALPEMLRRLGCEVAELYCDPSGEFMRGAEPLPENLTDLGKKVLELNADVGFATDPDGDRLAVVDNTGRPIGEEYTLVVCADGYLQTTRSSAPLVTNLSTTMALDRIAEKYGVEVIRSAVGEINVVQKMKSVECELGGEGNGGVILADAHHGRDSLVGVTLFLQRMVQDSRSLAEIYVHLPHYVMIKDKIQLGKVDPDQALKRIASAIDSKERDWTDGLKLLWDNSWIHVRKSNTEPIIRVYAEAVSRSDAMELINRVKKII